MVTMRYNSNLVALTCDTEELKSKKITVQQMASLIFPGEIKIFILQKFKKSDSYETS